jgi:hypothetical protein
MWHNRSPIWFAGLTGLGVFLGASSLAQAQAPTPAPGPAATTPAPAPAPGGAIPERRFLMQEPTADPTPGAAPVPQPLPPQLACTGPVSRVIDAAFEGVKVTNAHFGANPGGGEGGQFDKTPVLTTRVTLAAGMCLDAHLSAIVGSKQTYGRSALTLFQVALTRLNPPVIGPRHMVGHFERPYGIFGPAVALEAERDVDMLAANFFQRVGSGPHEVPPGIYRVDVFWAGAPPGAPPQNGAIGAAFVLKLYLR